MHSYKRGFDQQHSIKIYQSIEDYHDQFLEADDEKKSECLRLMKGYAIQYLCLVPHSSKFFFKETARVLANSVAATDDFDPREASDAFECLAKYAHNLMEQPWRKEFHKIKLTSGFYIHNIIAHLSNAHELLLLLNYAATDDTTLEMTGVPDMKRLKAFSKDCFIACQECLILSQIWERFQQRIPDFPFTVQEAFRARSELVGDLETILKSLLYNAQEKQHEESKRQNELKERQREAFRLEQIQFNAEQAMREKHRQEEEDLQANQLIEEKHNQYMQKRAQLIANAQKADMDLKIQKQLEYDRKHVPTDRLIDYGDVAGECFTSEEDEVVKHVLSNTERFGNTEYRSQYCDKTNKVPPCQPLQTISNGGGSNLKELHEVAFECHLNQNRKHYSDNPLQVEKDRLIEDSLRNFEEKSSKVEEFQNRRLNPKVRKTTDGQGLVHTQPTSAFALYSGSTAMHREQMQNGNHDDSYARNGLNEIQNGLVSNANNIQENQRSHMSENASTSLPSSGFKGLKQRQDFPKTMAASSEPISSAISFLGKTEKMGYRGVTASQESESEIEAEREKPKQRQALAKSRVPADSISPESFDFEPSATSSSSPFEVGTDLLAASHGNYNFSNYKTNLNSNSEINKNVKDKDLSCSIKSNERNRKSLLSGSKKWDCPHCTFTNKMNPLICEVCSKSKDFVPEPEHESSPDSTEEKTTYANATRGDPNSLRLTEKPVLKLKKPEDISTDLKDYPPLDKSSSGSSLSVSKFRKGFTEDNNSNGMDENTDTWVCIGCTFKNFPSKDLCEMCGTPRIS